MENKIENKIKLYCSQIKEAVINRRKLHEKETGIKPDWDEFITPWHFVKLLKLQDKEVHEVSKIMSKISFLEKKQTIHIIPTFKIKL